MAREGLMDDCGYRFPEDDPYEMYEAGQKKGRAEAIDEMVNELLEMEEISDVTLRELAERLKDD